MPLNERDRIEILMMIGVGDRMRTQQEVCRLFHEMHPDREPVSQSTVSRIERKYRELGHVRDAPRQGRPKINENVQQDVILSALENPHCTVRQVSRDLNIGKSSVSNIFKKVKYHPYRVRLIHELAEDDFDRRTEFCEYMMDHNNQNNGFIANILFSDEATFFLNGHVNRQNTRYWSQENPHWMQEYHTQHPQKLIMNLCVTLWTHCIGGVGPGPYKIQIRIDWSKVIAGEGKDLAFKFAKLPQSVRYTASLCCPREFAVLCGVATCSRGYFCRNRVGSRELTLT
ncbi:hypothetical protein NQ318_000692 [Aromia moschata]|uniref:Transposase n=1 Tax=Aromia moschata TaxID=1265417 RepID=A0AAV8XC05_9CUCU|nr:hypothetical protein NQ318_000692 [Aromia moschata]